ncbi:MAG: TIGR04282 family arsenosugar biosynthesis glycosyltransferase, partial [Planctomycetota bacterium]
VNGAGPTQLGVFAKYWEPGAVKTRLAATVGAALAAEFHHRCLAVLLRRFQTCGDHRVLGFTPAAHRDAFQALAGPPWELQPQGAGDLGARMRGYFHAAFSQGYHRVVLIGSDSPHLRVPVVEAAWEALNTVPVVLGPSCDGGYYLIGGRPDMPEVFQDVAWGTAAVLRETLRLIKSGGGDWRLLETSFDVDTIDDVARLVAELERHPPSDMASLRRVCDRCLLASE